ncbi:MAG: hypothetical protein NTX93_11210 [Bacteroidia bacterium]|nr:hypothetical protein [Bacteroidia bacterium]
MKNLDLKLMGVQEMNALEMKETDGGFIWFLIAAAVVLLSSCVNGDLTVQIGGSHNSSNPAGGGTISADSSKLEIPINVPIGY